MTINELETAIYFCEQKINKINNDLQKTGGNSMAQLRIWKEKKEGLELLIEQTIMAINVPEKQTQDGKD